LKLVDLKFPEKWVAGFPGPQFGIKGMREYLGVPDRPLLNNMIKPNCGLTPEQAANAFYDAAYGGMDIIKDDELLSNPGYSNIYKRTKLIMEMEKRVYEEIGEHTFYAANITDTPDRILENAKAVRDAGGNMLMLNTFSAGFGALQMLVESNIGLPVMSHPDFAGVLMGATSSGMSAHLPMAKLLRICGADISVIPTQYGKLPMLTENVIKVLINLQAPMHGMKPCMPMPSGGMIQGQVAVMMSELGNDIVIGAGAAVHAHPMGPTAGARAFRQAVDAVMANIDLRDAADEFAELGAAIAAWGIQGDKEIYGLLK